MWEYFGILLAIGVSVIAYKVWKNWSKLKTYYWVYRALVDSNADIAARNIMKHRFKSNKDTNTDEVDVLETSATVKNNATKKNW